MHACERNSNKTEERTHNPHTSIDSQVKCVLEHVVYACCLRFTLFLVNHAYIDR
ncbi:hypothetical protein KC19_VG169600 [Ceratodon purpureus]|uniref:Uncharacterized protein n=1 Tax=Ceratodon purpureus TaxID=3225 RepID=A0A8T0HRD9_CERPU|nr:hypothetical protein KC19_VG169600 [Ceratodon purpureus]